MWDHAAYTGQLDSSLHNLKLGVWLDLPVSKKMLVGVRPWHYCRQRLGDCEFPFRPEPGLAYISVLIGSAGFRSRTRLPSLSAPRQPQCPPLTGGQLYLVQQ